MSEPRDSIDIDQGIPHLSRQKDRIDVDKPVAHPVTRFIIFALLMFAAKAEAGSYWINGSSCVLDPPSVTKAISTAGTIKHGAGQSGNIVLYCPIPSTLGFTPTRILMLYSATGNTKSDFIAAAINRMSLSAGSLGRLSNDTAMFNTNSSGNVVSQAKTWGVTWDPTSFIYWVRVDISRAAAGCKGSPCDQVLYGIQITN